MAEPIPSPQTLEDRIKNEFKQWPKDAVGKLKVEIEGTVARGFTVYIEKHIEEGEEGDVFRAQHDTQFKIGKFNSEEEAQGVSLKAQSVIANLG